MLTSAKHSQSDLKKNHETFCGLYTHPFPKALPACACVAAAEGLSRFPALRSPRPEPRPEP